MPPSRKEIGDFIDAAVQDPAAAKRMAAANRELLDARWLHGETTLHFLAVEGYATAVRLLAELGVDVNAVNDFGDTALIDVIVMENLELAQFLLEHGANPNATSQTHDCALHAAIQTGNPELIELLLMAGAKPLEESLELALMMSKNRMVAESVLARHNVKMQG